jgi:hypothetical protein
MTMSVDKVQTWLRFMHVPFEFNPETRTFNTEWDMDGTRFDVHISCRFDGWIHVIAYLLDTERVSPELRGHLYGELLRENWRLDDVTYSIDDVGRLCSENDIPEHSSLEGFSSEFNAVIFGVKRFWTKLEEYNLLPEEANV